MTRAHDADVGATRAGDFEADLQQDLREQHERVSRRKLLTAGGVLAAAGAPFLAACPAHAAQSAVHTHARVVVAAADAPAYVKASADYVCSGSADQVEINAAIDEVSGGRNDIGGGVQLTQGTYTVSTPIRLRGLVALSGVGWSSVIQPAPENTQCVIGLADDDVSMTAVCDLLIHGRRRRAHGIHYHQQAGSFHPLSAPDANHQIAGVYIWGVGSSDYPRDGIFFEGREPSPKGGGRASVIVHCRIRNAYRHGINIQKFSDAFVDGVHSNTEDSGGGHGFVVGGGNAILANCKGWYTSRDAFHVSSSRAQLLNCQAQDAGRYGFNLLNGAGTALTSCMADSCGRTVGGDGFCIAANNMQLNGCLALDRGQTPASPQQYGFRFANAPSHIFLTGTSRDNGQGAVAGSPGSNRYVRVVDQDAGVIKMG